MIKTKRTLRELVKSDFEAMTMEEQSIKIAIDELAGWLRQYSPLPKNGDAIGFKIGVSEDLASAIEANLMDEDAAEVLPNLGRV